MENNRGSFGSRLGFILVSAGCAIGIGNVWKFPYITGQNGGAIFVLFYVLFLVLMGLPVMTMELAIGRASRKTILKGYRTLESKGSKWHVHGWFCTAGCYILMMYYTTVSGWMLDYFVKYLKGDFDKVKPEELGDVFSNMLANPYEIGLFMVITVVVGFIVLSFGVQNGLESVNKVMMICLLGLIVILAFNSVTLEGAKEGLEFYLLPSLDRAKKVGLFKVITAAMNQAFFTLSIGMGTIEIFGSYMSDDNSLFGESIRIIILDTFVAIISGLIIFPACFSFSVEPDQGPSLIFVTLPKVFSNMGMSRLWGTLFFLFMTFASFSTVTAVFENLIAATIDITGISRRKSIIYNCIFMLIASIPCVLGYNVWKDLHIIGARDVLDSEDFIVSNILLPGGALIMTLFCVAKSGWGFDNYLAEVNMGVGTKVSPKIKVYLAFVLPILILIILLNGLL